MVVGSIGLFDIDHGSDSCEIGYSLGSRWWGKGYATEAVMAVLDFAFGTMCAHRVQATYHPDNIASKKVLEKCGMKYEGIMRDAQKNPDGSFSDLVICARLSID
jgi:ribosomal-protein-alanine N-acetyltransferase